jgi:hypothetical protein
MMHRVPQASLTLPAVAGRLERAVRPHCATDDCLHGPDAATGGALTGRKHTRACGALELAANDHGVDWLGAICDARKKASSVQRSADVGLGMATSPDYSVQAGFVRGQQKIETKPSLWFL